MSIHGHLWTIVPHLAKALRPSILPGSRLFSTSVPDLLFGSVRLTGRLSEVPGSRKLLVVIHGLGGSSLSKYTYAAAAVAHSGGLSCLRLNLRGADLLGEDFYHAGLGGDVAAALAAPALAKYSHVYLLGFSLGGHVALRYALEHVDPRVRALASVCAPLDLDASADEIDGQRWRVYRSHVLGGLKRMYRTVAARRELPLPLREALAIDTMREWDTRVVAPRHGFSGARDYYGKVSVGPHLGRVRTPSLLLQARHDPMVVERTVRPSLGHACAPVQVRWLERGGHIGFPPDVDLGMKAARGLEPQVIAWLEQHA